MAKKLTPKKIRLLNALFTERTIAGAYQKAGVSTATGDRYRKDPLFQKAYLAKKKALIEATNDQLRSLSLEAVYTLKRVLDNPEANDSNKIKAARVVLDTTYKNIEVEELRTQIEKLEQENDIN